MNKTDVALHEAGHAWVAHELGIPVMELSIVATDESYGHCHHGKSSEKRPWREHTMMALGGMAARCIAMGVRDARGFMALANGEGKNDILYATRITGSVTQPQQRRIEVRFSARFLRAWNDTLDIARAKMIYIERLARLLLRHGRMGKCCDPAITYFAEGHEMPNWHYCPWCGVKLAESEAAS